MRRAAFGFCLLALGCSDPLSLSSVDGPLRPTTPDPLTRPPELLETTQITPGPGMPVEYLQENGQSNNNLDVVRHQGLTYLAVRNGKNHFASPDVRMFVFSSKDEKTWTFETKIAVGHDVREPRFLSLGGRLFLYYANLGDNQLDFRPHGMSYIEKTGNSWTAPADFYRPGEPYIPWRVRVVGKKPYMLVYKNGEREYDFSGLPMDIEFLTTKDGLDWVPVDPEHGAVVLRSGGSETDFALDDLGDLYAVVRNEPGDETGWGSKICYAPRHKLANWSCKHDKKKYDSPNVFAFEGKIYLFGRRNVTDTGNFQLNDVPWKSSEALLNLIDYSGKPKRCSLWQVDRATLDVHFLLDLPSRGDTCFVSMLKDTTDEANKRFFVYNYSSPIDDPNEISWNQGQKGQTNIYRTVMRFFLEAFDIPPHPRCAQASNQGFTQR